MSVFALGREEKLYSVPETTYSVAASVPGATDALRFMTLNIAQTIERVQRTDKRPTRSYLETIVRRKSVSWSLDGYLLPSGAAGTAPDGWDTILEAVFGTQTVNSSTSVVYTLAKDYSKSLTMHRAVGNGAAVAVFAEMMRGAVPTTCEFTLSGQDEAKVSISGFASDVLRAGTSLLVTDTGTAVAVTTGTGDAFDAGQYVNIGSVTNQLIASVSTDTVTVPAHAAGTAGDKLVPSACVVSQTIAATAVPISGIAGSCSLAATTLDILTAKITLDNGSVAHNDKYGTDRADSFHLNNRKVSGEFTVRLTDSNFIRIAKTKNATKLALTLVAGTVAGSISTFSMPNVVLDYSAIPSTAEADIVVTVPFVAYASTSFEDELTLTFS